MLLVSCDKEENRDAKVFCVIAKIECLMVQSSVRMQSVYMH